MLAEVTVYNRDKEEEGEEPKVEVMVKAKLEKSGGWWFGEEDEENEEEEEGTKQK